MSPDPARAYLRWALLRAVLTRGWWLVTAVHLVVDARLSATQLLLVGVFQALVAVVAEVPAGVVADTVSRRRALVWAHVVRGGGMALTAVVGGFGPIVVTQCLWGLGWALSSGADVAWITDELDDPDRIDRVLVAQARRELLGTLVGLVGAGGLAAVVGREAVMVGAGVASIGQALAVARWPEAGFRPRRTRAGAAGAGREAVAVLHRGLAVARGDRVVGALLVATALVNGGDQGYGRLRERRLLAVDLPTAVAPAAWVTALAVASAVAGALVLRLVEARIEGAGGAVRAYAGACAAGVVGLVTFGHAPGAWAVVGALVVGGIALPVTRVTATVVANRRTGNDVRATVHSLLAQAEDVGELVLGVALVAVATGDAVVLGMAAVLVGGAGVVVSRGCRG